MSDSPVFHSKILLFGEYSIILHSMGLAVPYHLFEGRLLIKHITDNSRRLQQSNSELKAFCQYIKLRLQQNNLDVEFDVKSLEFDIFCGEKNKNLNKQKFMKKEQKVFLKMQTKK